MSSRQEFVDVVKSGALTIIKKRLLHIVTTKLLSWIPGKVLTAINPLLGLVVGFVAKELVEDSELLIFFLYVDFRTTRQGQKTYADMANNYKIQISGTKEQKELSENVLMASSRVLIGLKF